jgi:hypothetical protein
LSRPKIYVASIPAVKRLLVAFWAAVNVIIGNLPPRKIRPIVR